MALFLSLEIPVIRFDIDGRGNPGTRCWPCLLTAHSRVYICIHRLGLT